VPIHDANLELALAFAVPFFLVGAFVIGVFVWGWIRGEVR